MFRKLFTIIIFFGLIPGCKQPVAKSKPNTLAVGEMAPDFTLLDENRTPRTLSNYSGNKIVLYFYPKDDTAHCTKQACALRNSYSEYDERGIMIIGINYDSPQSHKNFKGEHQLPFMLLSDTDKKVAKMYGAYKGIFRYFVPARITFLINEEGTIIHIFHDVNVSTHADQIINAFDNLFS